jgi:excinuclease UvrABC nuclease subunit
MPFSNTQYMPYNKTTIEQLPANRRGCYGIFQNQGGWVYVGKSDDLRSRLLDHINGDNACINQSGATHFVVELTSGDPSARERELIIECNPRCNLRVG